MITIDIAELVVKVVFLAIIAFNGGVSVGFTMGRRNRD